MTGNSWLENLQEFSTSVSVSLQWGKLQKLGYNQENGRLCNQQSDTLDSLLYKADLNWEVMINQLI
jgi:hypothetical protein